MKEGCNVLERVLERVIVELKEQEAKTYFVRSLSEMQVSNAYPTMLDSQLDLDHMSCS